MSLSEKDTNKLVAPRRRKQRTEVLGREFNDFCTGGTSPESAGSCERQRVERENSNDVHSLTLVATTFFRLQIHSLALAATKGGG